MENLKETFQQALKEKKLSARQMVIQLGLNEGTYYHWLKANSMPTDEYKRICDFLEIEIKVGKHLDNEENATKKESTYLKDFIEKLNKEINELKFENFSLKRELGKFEGLLAA